MKLEHEYNEMSDFNKIDVQKYLIDEFVRILGILIVKF